MYRNDTTNRLSPIPIPMNVPAITVMADGKGTVENDAVLPPARRSTAKTRAATNGIEENRAKTVAEGF
ncbi:MAG: hypothetical protein PHY28_02515 [Dehalococcoidales bacterium]|nr:hypothetical protein [Dehalococcoidales bacterium]